MKFKKGDLVKITGMKKGVSRFYIDFKERYRGTVGKVIQYEAYDNSLLIKFNDGNDFWFDVIDAELVNKDEAMPPKRRKKSDAIEFKVGDMALVKRKSDRPPWITYMNRFVGGVYEVLKVSNRIIRLKTENETYWFPIESLGRVGDKVEEKESQPEHIPLKDWERF